MRRINKLAPQVLMYEMYELYEASFNEGLLIGLVVGALITAAVLI